MESGFTQFLNTVSSTKAHIEI